MSLSCSMADTLSILYLEKQQKEKLLTYILRRYFLPRILHELDLSSRVDVVWDRYLPMSIKGSTREKRGHSSRQRVTGLSKVPFDWQGFFDECRQ